MYIYELLNFSALYAEEASRIRRLLHASEGLGPRWIEWNKSIGDIVCKPDLAIVNYRGQGWNALLKVMNRARAEIAVLYGCDYEVLGLPYIADELSVEKLNTFMKQQGFVDAEKTASSWRDLASPTYPMPLVPE